MDEREQDALKAPGAKDASVVIAVNGQKFRLDERSLTGAALRRVPSPPIETGYDLFRVSDNPAEGDRLVRNDELLQLEDGDQFFATPTSIIPGQQRSDGCVSPGGVLLRPGTRPQSFGDVAAQENSRPTRLCRAGEGL